MKINKLLILLLAALLIGFGAGVARLFQLRFEAGDIYAAYSTLRADPLGAKAFYESLRNLSGISVRRHHQPLKRLRDGRDTTLLFLGASPGDWKNPTENLLEDLETLAAGGGRLVVTFVPELTPPRRFRLAGQATQEKQNPSRRDVEKPSRPRESKRLTPGKPERPTDEDDLPGMRLRTVPLKDRWGVDFVYRELPKNRRGTFEPGSALNKASAPLPAAVSWHTALTFDSLDPAWRVIYASGARPVVIERPWKLGSIVMAADSYFLSNEAMREERHPELLAWLIGPSTKIVFDEAHLGIEEESSVVALARTYRLHGLFAGLLLLAGLFVWKNSLSLVPPYEDGLTDAGGGWVIGQDSTVGLVQLLRRNISAREILGVCVAEWKKSRAQLRTDWQNKLARMQEIVEKENARASQARDPVGSYQTISRLLGERKSTNESKR